MRRGAGYLRGVRDKSAPLTDYALSLGKGITAFAAFGSFFLPLHP